MSYGGLRDRILAQAHALHDRRRARTDLCGGRPAMIVPTAAAKHRSLNSAPYRRLPQPISEHRRIVEFAQVQYLGSCGNLVVKIFGWTVPG